MKERRKYERFQLVLPVKMEKVTTRKKEIFNLRTKDISAAGAFLSTKEQFPVGTWCQLELTIPSRKIEELTGSRGYIEVTGVVVRSTADGVAICFDRECQILSLKDE